MPDHFPMTREEAAEVILGEEPWPKCNRCHGSGSYVTTTFNALNKTEQKRIECTLCRGYGRLQNYAYFLACEQLNLPSPHPPVSDKEKKNGYRRRR
jgi:hypothetical protein